jgi:methionine synthase II (cobalamin-independent)
MDGTTGRADFIRVHECAFPAKWQQIEDDRAMFKTILTRIEKKIDELDTKVDHHHKRMFVDNGTPSIQTRLTEGVAKFSAMDSRIKSLEENPATILKWAVGLVGILTAAGSFVVWCFGHVKFGG